MRTILSSFSTAALCAVLAISGTAIDPSAAAADPPTPTTPGPGAVPTAGAPELDAETAAALGWANDLAAEASQLLERWVSSGAVTEERLLARLYFPILGSSPPRFTTAYDALSDRELGPVQERYIAKSPLVVFAIVTDVNGYVPTHNARFAQPLTGNRATDAETNLTKRLNVDVFSLRAGRSEAPYLVQHYRLANGDAVTEVSVPVRVKGRSFGCARIAFRSAEK